MCGLCWPHAVSLWGSRNFEDGCNPILLRCFWCIHLIYIGLYRGKSMSKQIKPAMSMDFLKACSIVRLCHLKGPLARYLLTLGWILLLSLRKEESHELLGSRHIKLALSTYPGISISVSCCGNAAMHETSCSKTHDLPYSVVIIYLETPWNSKRHGLQAYIYSQILSLIIRTILPLF